MYTYTYTHTYTRVCSVHTVINLPFTVCVLLHSISRPDLAMKMSILLLCCRFFHHTSSRHTDASKCRFARPNVALLQAFSHPTSISRTIGFGLQSLSCASTLFCMLYTTCECICVFFCVCVKQSNMQYARFVFYKCMQIDVEKSNFV